MKRILLLATCSVFFAGSALADSHSADEGMMKAECTAGSTDCDTMMKSDDGGMMKADGDDMMKADGDDMMSSELTEEDIAACKKVLAGWSDDKLMKTQTALQGSASKSSEDLAAATMKKYQAAKSEADLMALKCKSVLLMQMQQDG